MLFIGYRVTFQVNLIVEKSFSHAFLSRYRTMMFTNKESIPNGRHGVRFIHSIDNLCYVGLSGNEYVWECDELHTFCPGLNLVIHRPGICPSSHGRETGNGALLKHTLLFHLLGRGPKHPYWLDVPTWMCYAWVMTFIALTLSTGKCDPYQHHRIYCRPVNTSPEAVCCSACKATCWILNHILIAHE